MVEKDRASQKTELQSDEVANRRRVVQMGELRGRFAEIAKALVEGHEYLITKRRQLKALLKLLPEDAVYDESILRSKFNNKQGVYVDRAQAGESFRIIAGRSSVTKGDFLLAPPPAGGDSVSANPETLAAVVRGMSIDDVKQARVLWKAFGNLNQEEIEAVRILLRHNTK